MDAGSLTSLHHLTAMGGRSLLQYVNESSPWTSERTRGEFTQIQAMAHEEYVAVAKLMRYLQKRHQRRVVLGSYPSYFTMMNYITVEHLLPKLIADAEHQIAEIEKAELADTDEEVRTMVHAYVEMKKRHLDALKNMRTPVENAIV